MISSTEERTDFLFTPARAWKERSHRAHEIPGDEGIVRSSYTGALLHRGVGRRIHVTAGGILVSDVGWSSASGRGTKDAENVLSIKGSTVGRMHAETDVQ
jgi:hypothetical protein